MRYHFAGAAGALILGCLATAQAADSTHADPSVVVRTDPAHVRSAVIDAAEKLCTKALANDHFDDFGTQEECVDDTVTAALAKPDTAPSAVSQLVAAVK